MRRLFVVPIPFAEVRRLRPFALAAVAVSGVLAGGFLGATTNAVNAIVSPLYFVTILHWRDVENVWRAGVAQGALEGLLFGVLFSLIFSAATGIITGCACTYRFAVKHLLGILAATYASWALGGAAGVGLAAISPEWYRRTFVGVPQEFGAMLAYGWVGGSIWGAELGCLMWVILGLVVLRSNWRRRFVVGKCTSEMLNVLRERDKSERIHVHDEPIRFG
jgi:hypothetical protein